MMLLLLMVSRVKMFESVFVCLFGWFSVVQGIFFSPQLYTCKENATRF